MFIWIQYLFQICQRLEDDYNAAKTTLSELRVSKKYYFY